MFAYIMPNADMRRYGRSQYRIEIDFIYKRRPVYRVDVLRGRLSGEQTANLLSRFRGSLLFPEGYDKPNNTAFDRRGYEAYLDKVFSESVLRLLTFPARKESKICLVDSSGRFILLASRLAFISDRFCILTEPERIGYYSDFSEELLRSEKIAVPVFTDEKRIGNCDIAIDCGGGILPKSKVYLCRKITHGYRNAVVPASALPDNVLSPSGYHPMTFSYALHAYCDDAIRPAKEYYCSGRKYTVSDIINKLYITI